jgi:hypothetical protein
MVSGYRFIAILSWRLSASIEQRAPAQVHAALVYYYDHRDEIDRELVAEATARAAWAARGYFAACEADGPG